MTREEFKKIRVGDIVVFNHNVKNRFLNGDVNAKVSQVIKKNNQLTVIMESYDVIKPMQVMSINDSRNQDSIRSGWTYDSWDILFKYRDKFKNNRFKKILD